MIRHVLFCKNTKLATNNESMTVGHHEPGSSVSRRWQLREKYSKVRPSRNLYRSWSLFLIQHAAIRWMIRVSITMIETQAFTRRNIVHTFLLSIKQNDNGPLLLKSVKVNQTERPWLVNKNGCRFIVRSRTSYPTIYHEKKNKQSKSWKLSVIISYLALHESRNKPNEQGMAILMLNFEIRFKI